MLAHIVLITVGYAAGDLLASPLELWTLTVDYPGMLLAVAGHGLPGHGRRHQHQGGPAPAALRVVAPAAPLRLPRRRARAAAPAVDRRPVPRPRPRARCSGGPPGRRRPAAILVWRLGLPAYRTLRHDLRVTSVVREDDGVVSVYVTGRDLPRSGSRPASSSPGGSSPGRAGRRAHPYSLSAAPDGRSLRITVKDLGDGSRDVARLRPGTRVLVEGPYGRLSARARTPAPRRPDRRRGRHHPDPRAGRGARVRAGRGRPACTGTPTARCSAASSPCWRRAGAARRRPARPPRTSRPTRAARAAAPRARPRRTATSTSAGPRQWAAEVRRVALAAGLPARAPPPRDLQLVTR